MISPLQSINKASSSLVQYRAQWLFCFVAAASYE